MIELEKKTKIKRIEIPMDKRCVFISDIHGDVDSLKKGLEMIHYTDEDYLFMIGDMYEKGDFKKNLETIRYIMDLKNKYKNLYCMAGNCDEVLRFILPKDAKEKFLYYANVRMHSVINDMAEEMKYPLSMDMNVEDFVCKVQQKYPEIYEFMESLDDVIFINDRIVLVHGGIDDIDHIPEYALPMLKYDRFYELSKPQKKLMVVGHYPTRNYRSDMACCNPIFDFKKKIISIDGGNHIVKGGQLNFVILESLDSMKFSFVYVDHYPKHRMKYAVDYEQPLQNVNIVFGQNEVEILDTDLDFVYIRQISTNMNMWVHNSFIYKDERTDKVYCYDGCNQFISTKKNDEISVIKKAMPYSLIKRNGYIGLIETKYIDDEI